MTFGPGGSPTTKSPMTDALTHIPEERALIAAARAGDERAFRALVEPHRRALEVHCYRMLGSPQDAEDLVQETLLRAWRGLERFERRATVHTWLYRIATNACLDELERRPRRPEPVEPLPDERLDAAAAPLVDPAARYAQREGVELAFLRAIQELPGRQRAVLLLRDVLGMTAPEVADLLDSTVAAVNSALQRARGTVDSLVGAPATATTALADRDEQDLLARYLAAWERTDIDGLVALMQEDAVLRMPPQRALLGAAEIGRFFAGETPLLSCGIARIVAEPARANGRPALVMRRREADGTLSAHGLLVLRVEAGVVAGLEAFIGEDVVRRFERDRR
jgi:RNA polymerase sigma-70 factor, ECF subfamily